MVPLLHPTRSPGAGSREYRLKPARFRLARTAAERAIELSPDNPTYRRRLVEIEQARTAAD